MPKSRNNELGEIPGTQCLPLLAPLTRRNPTRLDVTTLANQISQGRGNRLSWYATVNMDRVDGTDHYEGDVQGHYYLPYCPLRCLCFYAKKSQVLVLHY